MSRALKNDLVLRAARGEQTPRTPVWMMRQAGRFDPAYRALREQHDAPLEELFRTPEVAAEISLLPKRFGVDAIIFYQDILTPLAAMGAEFTFRPGPVLAEPVRSASRAAKLHAFDPAEALPFVAEELRLVGESLYGDLPLLGFAGAPLTLAYFLIEGGSPGTDPQHARRMYRDEPEALHAMLELLADATADYLAYQIEAGVDAVQLFESVGDLLTEDEYRELAHPYHVRVFQRLAAKVPTILFVKERPWVELMSDSGANVISVGTCVDLADARQRLGHKVALQGNVDNEIVARGTFEQIDAAVKACVEAGGHEGHILNLSHGVLRETPFDNGCRVVQTCKTMRIDRAEPARSRP